MHVSILCHPEDIPLIERQLNHYQGQTKFTFENRDDVDFSVNYVGSRIPSNAKNKVAFVGEPSDVFAVTKEFAEDYHAIVTCQYTKYIKDKVILHSPILPWQLEYSYDKSQVTSKLFDPEYYKKKTKLLSVITSGKALTSTQLQRIKFVRMLKEVLDDQVDVFGLDKKFDNKSDALIPYKYSVVIENNTTPHMWTEKLADCLIADTVPFYYGAPNVFDYFNRDSILPINIYDEFRAIQFIREVLRYNMYSCATKSIKENQNKALHDYNLFTVIDKLTPKFMEKFNG